MASPPETEIDRNSNSNDERKHDESNDEKLSDLNFPETDVTLVVEGRKIHVNKSALSQHSPVFKAMFSGNFKESTQKEVPLQHKKFQDVVEFLQCFYPNMRHEVTELNVLKVLPLAHEYQSPLVDVCEDLMISMCKQGTGLTVTSLLDYIIAAEKYDLKTFLDTAVEFCSHFDYDLLNGKTIERRHSGYDTSNSIVRVIYNDYVQENKEISSKFLDITLKTRHAISVKRLQVLERNKRKMKNKEKNEDDYIILFG